APHAVAFHLFEPAASLGRRDGRAGDGNRLYKLGMSHCEHHDRYAAALAADDMRQAARNLPDERREIVHDDFGRQRKVLRHRSRLAEAALVVADRAVAARKVRHPGAPRLGVLGKSVHEHHRFRPRPGVGVVVHFVEKLAPGQFEMRHCFPSVISKQRAVSRTVLTRATPNFTAYRCKVRAGVNSIGARGCVHNVKRARKEGTRMTYKCLLYDVRDRIATLTLNRPERLNALGDSLREELYEAVTKSAADPDVGVMVITGAGRGFCSGGDVKSMSERDQTGQATAASERLAPIRDRVILAMRDCPKPVIAAVNGAAAGAGKNPTPPGAIP